jgi:glucose/mannose transport system substrate-binding protein
LPVRGDVDLAAANDCMKKGLEILAKGNVIQGTDQLLSADSQKQKEDLFSEFFATPIDDAGRRAEALRRNHRFSRLINCSERMTGSASAEPV